MVFSIRNIAAFLLSCLLLHSGRLRTMKRRAEKGEILLSVYFHDPSKELFESTLKWFLKNNFTFISVEDLRTILHHKKPFPSKAVVLTCDDGWKNNYENVIEVANKYKAPITIFATTTPVETGEAYWWSFVATSKKMGIINETATDLKKLPDAERVSFINELKPKVSLYRESMTVEEVKQADATRYVSIESHTITHPMLSKCTDEKSRFEIFESKKILEQWLQRNITHFAYPNGDYSAREIKNLEEAGYAIAFSTVPQYVTPDQHANMYEIPRFDVLEDVSFTENICRMTGLWFDRRSKGNPKS